MTSPQSAILLIVAVALGLLAVRRWRSDIIAVMALLAAVLAGVVPADGAFTGFSDPVVFTVAALLIVGEAVRRSGLPEAPLRLLSPVLRWPGAEAGVLSLSIALTSAFIGSAESQATTSLSRIVRRGRGLPQSSLAPALLATQLGGFATLVGTLPNLLVSSVRQRFLGQGYAIFDFAPVGVVLAAVGLVYVAVAWWVPTLRRPAAVTTAGDARENNVVTRGYTSEVLVPTDSAVAGQTVSAFEKRGDWQVKVIAIVREEYRRILPRHEWVIEPGDVLVLACEPETLQRIMEQSGLRIVGRRDWRRLDSERIGIAEVVVAPGSELIGRSPSESRLDERFGISLLAIGRSDGQLGMRLRRTKLRAGDVLIMQVGLDSIAATLVTLGCLLLAERRLSIGRPRGALAPALTLVAALTLAAAGWLSVAVALLCAVVLLVVARVTTLVELYRSIAWPVIVVIGAFLPISAAFKSTGAIDRVVELLAPVVTLVISGAGPAVLVAVASIGSFALAYLTGVVAAVLTLAPLATGLASRLGFEADPLLMAVAVGASCDILTSSSRTIDGAALALPARQDGRYSDHHSGLLLGLVLVLLGIPVIMLTWPLHL